MKKIDDPSQVRQWGYQDARLGVGFSGTRDSIIVQVQSAYVKAGISFHEQEIPALIENFMCEQGLAGSCSERIEGLGDVIHVAAKLVDKVFGTGYALECESCAKRRAAFNHAVSFK